MNLNHTPQSHNDININIYTILISIIKGTEVGTRTLMFADNDSLGVNNKIAYEIFNDTLDMLRPECKAYEADHQGLRASAINCSMLKHLQ